MRNIAFNGQPSAYLLPRKLILTGVLALLPGWTSLPGNAPGNLVADMFAPDGSIHAVDRRGAFRRLFCDVNDAHGASLPDYRGCGEALRTIAPEPDAPESDRGSSGDAEPMTLLVVLGLGFDCFGSFIDGNGQLLRVAEQLGHSIEIVDIDGLGTTNQNAEVIRDRIGELVGTKPEGRLVLLGYSKGTNDILSALVAYPEVAEEVDAVVSIAGAVGGSQLALSTGQWSLGLLEMLPGATCSVPDGNVLESLYPSVRRAWLEQNSLPGHVAYFSVVSFPDADRLSTALRPGFRSLAEVDARNDGQVTALDQVIPGSTVLGFVNADHWAVTLPVTRSHPWLAAAGINQNDFPREVLLEAILKYVDMAVEVRTR